MNNLPIAVGRNGRLCEWSIVNPRWNGTYAVPEGHGLPEGSMWLYGSSAPSDATYEAPVHPLCLPEDQRPYIDYNWSPWDGMPKFPADAEDGIEILSALDEAKAFLVNRLSEHIPETHRLIVTVDDKKLQITVSFERAQ